MNPTPSPPPTTPFRCDLLTATLQSAQPLPTNERAVTATPAERHPAYPDLWHRYHHTPDTETEGQLIQQYLPLVKTVVGRIAITLPAHVSLDDLHSAGVIGLLQALRSYQPGNRASFETFARIRIRGAVLDELRRMDWVPRSVHDKARKLRHSLAALEQQTGRVPEDHEIAQALHLSLADYRQLLEEVRPATFVHLDSQLHPEGNDLASVHESVPDDSQEIPRDAAVRQELIELVQRFVQKLPEVQRKVLALYYVEDLRLKEIAAVFGLTESRISQIHSAAILAIRGFVERHEARPPGTPSFP
ncbi:MAG: FliA/WhiG family RNA polymerase sigma factor [Verrucomicrobiales bacterium]|nr:FliA/WhiG family RNA polymerase sigma factor [Verrucomicrobiales bacterium]